MYQATYPRDFSRPWRMLIKIDDYLHCMTQIFSDKTKFNIVKTDPTQTQLNTLQSYLRTILNRGEITTSEYNDMRPISTRPAKAHGTLNNGQSLEYVIKLITRNIDADLVSFPVPQKES